MVRSARSIRSTDSDFPGWITIPSNVGFVPSFASFVSLFLNESRYDQTLIRVIVVLAYLGWVAHGATTILFPDRPSSYSKTISSLALTALGFSWTFFTVQKSPWSFYIYVAFPCYFWREAVVASSGPISELYRSGKLQGSIKLLLHVVFVIAALQSMVVCVATFPCPKRVN